MRSTIDGGISPSARAGMGGRLPALTPMRIGMARSFASLTTVRTFSGSRMLPGLRRRGGCFARVGARGGKAGADRRQRPAVVEVDVGDEGDGCLADDLRQGGSRLLVGNGDADGPAAEVGERGDLAHRHGGGRRVRAAVGGAAADLDVADLDLLGEPSLRHRILPSLVILSAAKNLSL